MKQEDTNDTLIGCYRKLIIEKYLFPIIYLLTVSGAITASLFTLNFKHSLVPILMIGILVTIIIFIITLLIILYIQTKFEFRINNCSTYKNDILKVINDKY